MELVAFLGNDKENWGQAQALINRMECEKVILIKNKNSPEFPKNEKTKIFEFDTSLPLLELKTKILEKLKPELSGDFEIALSLASGNGKEHMAVLSALLSIPVGVKIVAYTKDGIKFLT